MNVLNGVHTLSEEHFEATIVGHVKLLRGILDEETYPFRNLSSFGYLSSLSKRTLNNRFRRLLTEEYLEENFNYHYGVSFLSLTKKAKALPLVMLKSKESKKVFINFHYKED